MDSRYTDLTNEIKAAEAAAAGSKEAFCELYGKYRDRLYRYALYRLGDPSDAEDAVSECVLAAWQGLPGLRKPEAFGSWIFRILHACCAKRIKDSVRLRENMQRIYRRRIRSVRRRQQSRFPLSRADRGAGTAG